MSVSTCPAATTVTVPAPAPAPAPTTTTTAAASAVAHAAVRPACAVSPGQLFLQALQQDIAHLSEPAVEMTAALVAVQMGLPAALSDWIVAELGQRVDLRQVSPIASATMRLGLASSLMHTPLDLPDTEPDFALIKALGREAALNEARAFLHVLVHHLESLATGQKC